MEKLLDQMLAGFESGRVTRRDLLMGIAAMASTANRPAGHESLFQGVELNHVTLRVSDLERSKKFYQKLLGLPVLKDEPEVCYLGLGKSFISLWHRSGGTPGVDHYCIGVKGFDPDAARARIEKAGMTLNPLPDDPTIYVLDPDRIVVQLEARGFR